MDDPQKVSQEEYDEFRSRMEEKYGYEDMSEEEKADFDAKLDQVAVVEGKQDKTDADEADDGDELEKGEFDDGHPQSHGDVDEGVR